MDGEWSKSSYVYVNPRIANSDLAKDDGKSILF
jgi:hypothetical protein